IGIVLRRLNLFRTAGKLGRSDRRPKLRDRGFVALQVGSRIVERSAADEAAREELFLALDGRCGKVARRGRLPELLLDRGDFGWSLAILQIGEPRVGALQLLLGLAARGSLVVVLEGEQRRAKRDLIATLHRKLLQRAAKRRGNANVLAFDVALQRTLALVVASGEADRQCCRNSDRR